VRSYREYFRGTADRAWLPAVGAAQWVVITNDQNIRRNQLEIDAIFNAGVRAFVITAGGMHVEEQIELLLRAMPKIYRICHQRGPFIYTITRSGIVSRISNRTLRRRARQTP